MYAQLNVELTEATELSNKNIEWDSTHYCKASALTKEELIQFRVVPLVEIQPPDFNSLTQTVARNGCEKVDDQWQQKWEITEIYATQEEKDVVIAEHSEMVRLAAIPSVVTMRQARLALLGAGMLSAADAAIAAMPGIEGDAARIEWEYAHEVRRDAPLVAGMVSALGLTNTQLEQLFVAAVVM